ncbi:OmpH family outer membrane protein [Rickettsiella endosymbiont of Miltochrista miniata]|uniref:OmpH family outer membrane protein n=1 Tax=Rickettsiella endosymbiont of Miltochrista miniata TaxID=3066239 RepID=UPI00313D414F
MNKVCLVSIVTLMTGLLAVSAQAEEVKLAVVDMQVVLQKAPQIAKINDALTRQFKGRQDSIVKEQNQLRKEAENLQKNAAVMKAADRSALENKLMTDENKVKSMVASFQSDLSKQQSESLHSFSQQLDSVVSKVAAQSGYDLVIQKGSTLYAKNNLDITQQILEALKRA